MASYRILLLFILFSSLSFATTQAQYYSPNSIIHDCYNNGTIAGSAFQLNLRTLFSSLSINALSNTNGFYNTTVPADKPSDTVFGFFMCRGDLPPQLCQQCVQTATQRLFTKCSLSTQAMIWYDMCMVRYSNNSAYSTSEKQPRLLSENSVTLSFFNPKSFMRLLYSTMNKTADEAARGGVGGKKFATREANVYGFHTLYCLAQCTPDLSPHDCRSCLSREIEYLPVDGIQGRRVASSSCNIRYELYPFYWLSTVASNRSTPAYIPVSIFSKPDSEDDPTYLYHNCSSSTDVIADPSYKMKLKTLLSYMSSNATNGMKAYNDHVEETVYGLFMCRGDLPSRLCQQCILNATQKISTDCSSSQEAIIWYNHCMLRYSDWNFFYYLRESPTIQFQMLNVTTISNPVPEQKFFTFALSNTLANLALAAWGSSGGYQTKSLKLNDLQTLYTLAQCTPDLSNDDCEKCLEEIIGQIPWSRLGSVGGRILYPSCNLRFESFQFYGNGEEAQSSSLKGKRKGHLRIMISVIVPTIVSVILLFLGYYLVKRKLRKSIKNILKENFGHESVTLEPLQFNLAVIQAATNNFSNENRIGKGGFGEVYKGVLPDGQQIAAKRLSKSSKQGANEFKNEVLLIAKLQHRNLVAFIGFCLEDQEKILIYEYVPNKSLDYFLFDSQRAKLLNWFERYNIIGGIVRGIHYLHDLSRLKVIHRDLKPSNVLLDENLTPKISDFGLARIVEINQDQGSTNRIVGTYGYMPPEYAMFGRFSEKSDVFSFGVMVLEIIIGKKNSNSYELQSVADGLLNYVWRQWRDQTLLSILDPSIKENFSENEVIKCLQIGLLCVQLNPDARPTMAEVLSYFSSCSIEIPSPQEPAFYSHDRMDSNVVAQESSSSQSINGSTPCSVNEMSISQFLPRYGYMPPEYAMFGRFSEKSDVFSFGVMVLEIIIGKKNSNSYESHSVADGLFNNVWRQWRDQTLLSILDPSIKENFSENEVIKCLQIGLLCVQLNPDARPTMAEVVSYFSSCSVEIPSPQEPAFYSHDRMDSNVFAQESSSSQSINGSTPCSVNEMSISQFLPR